MQYKKEEVRNRILSAATDEFEREGYTGSSIKQIAFSAKVPTGNLYRYFASKAALFDGVVGETYRTLPSLIQSEFDKDKSLDRNVRHTAKVFAEGIENIFAKFRRQMLILADKSAGSQFEDFYSSLCSLLTHMVHDELFRLSPDDFLFAKIISKSFLDGLFALLRESNDIKDGVEKLLLFYFYKIEERII